MKNIKKNIVFALTIAAAAGLSVLLVTNFALQSGSLFQTKPPLLERPPTDSGEYSVEYEQETGAFAKFKRFARVYVPWSYFQNRPAPVVFMFHGGGGNSAQAAYDTKWNDKADEEGFIVVYPEGIYTPRAWNAGECCGDSARRDVDDVGFVMRALEKLDEYLEIDRSRIYATGFSNGSSLAYRLACEESDVFAAIAGVSGPTVLKACNPQRAVPILHLHGSEDTAISPGGGEGESKSGYQYPSIEENIALWSSLDSCDESKITSYDPLAKTVRPPLDRTSRLNSLNIKNLLDFTKTKTPSSSGILCTKRKSCDDSVEVTYCMIEGWGHEWPVGWRTAIEGSDFIWDQFFSKYSL